MAQRQFSPPPRPLAAPVAALLAAVGFVLAFFLSSTLLLVFAGVLLAVILDAAALGLGRLVRWPRLIRLVLVTMLLLGGLAVSILWGGMRLAMEAQNLFEIATNQADVLIERVEEMGWMPAPTDHEGGETGLAAFLPDTKAIFGHAKSTFSIITGAATNIIVIAFLGIFFAADPVGYREGFLRLLPVEKRDVVRSALVDAGHSLRWWLVGQVVTMALVTVSVSAMLFATGIPNAILLGLISGLLNFIPFLGPILAAIPIFLASMSEGASTLIPVMSLFIVIQSLEGYLISPLIQKRAVSLPPAWSLTALVAFGVLFGPMGVALATPVLAVARVLVLRLYVEERLERPAEPLQYR